MKLTVKQQRFCDEYIKSGNATQAYKKAGYSANTDSTASSEGSKLLRKPRIQAYISEHTTKASESRIASAEEILTYLSDVVRGKATETIVNNTGRYDDVPVRWADRINAAKELLKRYPTDPTAIAQLRKLKAEAELTEEKVKAAKQLTNDDNVKLNELLDGLEKGVGLGRKQSPNK